MRTRLVLPSLVALLSAGLIASPGLHAQAADGSSQAARTPTAFAMKTSGFGTRVQGGQVPANSDTTGYDVISCTNEAGRDHRNYEASVTLPGAGLAEGVKTHAWTATGQDGARVSSSTVHDVARVTLAQTGAGKLVLTAIHSKSSAVHDATGFHPVTSTSIGGVSLVSPGMPAQSFPVPTPGQPLTIPGVATVAVGTSHESATDHAAHATANAADVHLLVSDTRVRIAHSAAHLYDGVIHGIFKGNANATRATGVADNVRSGPTPLQYVPCQGTGGDARSKSIASLDLGGNIAVQGLSTKVMGKQTADKTTGYASGRVASFNLGDGQLVITGIVGRVNVDRLASGRLIRTLAGTTVGSITSNGDPQSFPDTGVLTIPGVAKIERSLSEMKPNGLAVTAVRITLLDGSGAVINLGQAQLKIKPSGR